MKKLLITLSVLASALTMTNLAQAGNVEAGKAAAAKYACASCHGADYNSPIDPSYPKLAGQHRTYLEHALKSYRRGGDKMNGRGNAIMGATAKPLSNKEIADLAAFMSSLPGSLVLQK